MDAVTTGGGGDDVKSYDLMTWVHTYTMMVNEGS